MWHFCAWCTRFVWVSLSACLPRCHIGAFSVFRFRPLCFLPPCACVCWCPALAASASCRSPRRSFCGGPRSLAPPALLSTALHLFCGSPRFASWPDDLVCCGVPVPLRFLLRRGRGGVAAAQLAALTAVFGTLPIFSLARWNRTQGKAEELRACVHIEHNITHHQANQGTCRHRARASIRRSSDDHDHRQNNVPK